MKIAICAIIKDEQKYLKEWIDWNLNLGFDSIYLYEDYGSKSHSKITDNYSNVNLFSVSSLETKIDKLFLSKNKQLDLYTYFCKEYVNLFDWVAFIDIDEFINLKHGLNLKTLLSDYVSYSGILLEWNNIGASYYISSQDNVVDTYKIKVDANITNEKFCLKSIVNLEKFKKFINHHECDGSIKIDSNIAWINHYITKSLNDWFYKIKLRGDIINNNRKLYDFFICNNKFSPLMKLFINDIYFSYLFCHNKYHDTDDGLIFIKLIKGARFGNIMFMISYAYKIMNKQKIILDKNDFYNLGGIFHYMYNFLGLNNITKFNYFNLVKKDYLITDDNSDIIPKNVKNFLLYGFLQEEPSVEFLTLIKKNIDKRIINDYVAIHVRRTDFMSNRNSYTFPVMSKEFYAEAMSYFPKDTKFMFVSDDIQWCKDNFKGENIYFSGKSDIEDFKLLLGAKSVIFGNSTFAYWGAILNINENKDKKIICNKNWYTEESNMNYLTDKIIPKEWITLNYKYNIKK